MIYQHVLNLGKEDSLKRAKAHVEAYFRVKFSDESFLKFLKEVSIKEIINIENRFKEKFNKQNYALYDDFLEELSLAIKSIENNNFNYSINKELFSGNLSNEDSKNFFEYCIGFFFGYYCSLDVQFFIIKGSLLAKESLRAIALNYIDNNFSKKEIAKFKEFYFFFLSIKAIEHFQNIEYGNSYFYRSLFSSKITKDMGFPINFEDYYSFLHLRLRDSSLTRKAFSVIDVCPDFLSREEKSDIYLSIENFVLTAIDFHFDRDLYLRERFLKSLSAIYEEY